MTLTLQQIQALPLKERNQLGACINYFNSKQYYEHKHNKQIMTARQEIENEHSTDKDDRNS